MSTERSRTGVERGGALCAAVVALCVLTAGMVQAENVGNGGGRQAGNAGGTGHATPRGSATHAPGYLGILFRELNDDQVAELHLKAGRGVEVRMVDHDGPAGKAGLREHDVIVSVNGQAIQSGLALSKTIHDAGVGADLSLVVLRGDSQVTVTTQLADRDDVEREARKRMETTPVAGAEPVINGSGFVEGYATEATPAPAADPHDAHGPGLLGTMLHSAPYTGLAMAAMEPQLAAYFGAPAGVGMLVQTVAANSPAAAAGLRAGDVVLKADAVAIHNSADWTKRLHASKGGPMALTVLRDKHEMTVTLAPGLKKHSMLEWPRLW